MRFSSAHIEAIRNMVKKDTTLSVCNHYTLGYIEFGQIPANKSSGAFLNKNGASLENTKLTGTFFYEDYRTGGWNINVYLEGKVQRLLYEPNIFNYENNGYTFNKVGLSLEYIEAVSMLYIMAEEYIANGRKRINDIEKEDRERAGRLL